MADTTYLGQALQHAICAIRAEKGLTQQELAERSGLSRQYISLVERQKRVPGLETVFAISQGLGVSFATLCGEIERLVKHYQTYRPALISNPGDVIAADSSTLGWKEKLPLKQFKPTRK